LYLEITGFTFSNRSVSMIIECEKCQTKFNFDERLLKEEGSKVRCSYCGEIFRVYPKAKEDDEPLKQEFIGLNEDALGFDEGLKGEGEKTVIGEETIERKGEEEAEFEEPIFIDKTLPDLENAETVFLETLPDSDEEEFASEINGVLPVRKDRQSKSFLFTVILIVFSFFIGVCAVFIFFYPEMVNEYLPFLKTPEKMEITDTGVRRLSFNAVTGSFINSKDGGRLFVIRGMVKNEYPKSRSYILIKGAILDNMGREVKKKQVYAGNVFNEVEIRELLLDNINKAMEEPNGMGMKNVNVAPGASIPFMIVFDNLPENLSEFTVEAVSSSQGS